MTVIAAVSDGKRAWIGADSCGTQTATGIKRYDCTKLIRLDRFVFGLSGKELGLATLRHTVARRKLNKARGIYELAGEIAFALKQNINLEDADVLVAERGQVYGLWEGKSISLIDTGVVAACGSGAKFAVGAGNALLRTKKFKAGPELLEFVIEETSRWASGCGGPIHVVEVK